MPVCSIEALQASIEAIKGIDFPDQGNHSIHRGCALYLLDQFLSDQLANQSERHSSW